ncbi:hypothetical protein PLESTF_001644400 [Pleodorina starrii]|nr:hypothetical protein PLESTF_001644400 [Pleodorina starrii]
MWLYVVTEVRELQVAVAELRSLKQGRRVFYRSGGVFLLASRDEQLQSATDKLQQLLGSGAPPQPPPQKQ